MRWSAGPNYRQPRNTHPSRTLAALLTAGRKMDSDRDRLTRREWQVLRLLKGGTPSRGIAIRLGISYATVRAHLRGLGRTLTAQQIGEVATASGLSGYFPRVVHSSRGDE